MNVSGSFEDEEFYDVQEAAPSTTQIMIDDTLRSSSSSTFDRDELEKCGHWLVSIPRDDVMALRKTPEYNDFIKAFDKLGHAHRSVLLATTNKVEGTMQLEHAQHSSFSFLQHMAVDDVVLRVMEFLECRSLIRASSTCSRFHNLTHKSATQRTHQIGKERQLDHIFKLLRAKEEIDGSATLEDCYVPVPMLGLPKRVLVTEAGDPEFNGIYYCTGCDGNGYLFTKPRNGQARQATTTARSFITNPLTLEELELPTNLLQDLPQPPSPGFKTSALRPNALLRCIIAKRFSDETILWYMSKEVETDVAESSTGETEVTHEFSFWAKLMVTDEASIRLCQYPSQSDILTRQNGYAWQPLSGEELPNPPIVELID